MGGCVRATFCRHYFDMLPSIQRVMTNLNYYHSGLFDRCCLKPVEAGYFDRLAGPLVQMDRNDYIEMMIPSCSAHFLEHRTDCSIVVMRMTSWSAR